MNSNESNTKVLYAKNKELALMGNDWDDSELIKMYERSTAKTYEKVQNSVSNAGGASVQLMQQGKKWKVGDTCMAPFEEDDKWYPARIESISKKTCTVQFIGYDSKTTVNLNDLMTEEDVEWVGEEDSCERDETMGMGTGQNGLNEASDIKPLSFTNNQKIITAAASFSIPDHCPPPPPALFCNAMVAGSEKEAYTNALMSWYMAGYHTGFYQGMVHQKTLKPKPREETL